LNCL
jgi:nuclear cap-binding protein subunit 2